MRRTRFSARLAVTTSTTRHQMLADDANQCTTAQRPVKLCEYRCIVELRLPLQYPHGLTFVIGTGNAINRPA